MELLTLDEIIKERKISGAIKSKSGAVPKKSSVHKIVNRPVFKETPRIHDARLKIIENNRSKIRDARDKIIEISRASGLDARERIIQRQKLAGGAARRPVSERLTGVPYRANVRLSRKVTRLPDLVTVPRGYVDYDNMEQKEQEEYAAASRLFRTVKNDIPHYEQYSDYYADASPPPAPRSLETWGNVSEYDPFDVYEVPHTRRISSELPPPPSRGILRPSTIQHGPRNSYDHEERSASSLSYEMRSRLEHAPDPHVSMGIFSKNSLLHGSSNGYRIVVSNLHASVTQSDIKELFEDIGEMYDSRIVRPGVAEVIYKSLTDAERAVDTYHNRQLDGQPMKCLLVNPRSSNKPTAPAIKTSSSNSRLISGHEPLEIDIDALHKVLFRRQ